MSERLTDARLAEIRARTAFLRGLPDVECLIRLPELCDNLEALLEAVDEARAALAAEHECRRRNDAEFVRIAELCEQFRAELADARALCKELAEALDVAVDMLESEVGFWHEARLDELSTIIRRPDVRALLEVKE